MADPLSITCPHCTASFKVKSTAAFGKKVKCPKCDEPFVIQQPTSGKPTQSKKKRQKIKPEVDFFEDDSNSSTDMFEDDFESWDDDLSSGPKVKPVAKKKQKQPNSSPPRKNTKSEFSLGIYGFTPLGIVLTFLLIFLNLIALISQNPIALNITFGLALLIGSGSIIFGGIWFLIIVTEESLGELVLCLIVPLYSLYYAVSRFDQTKKSYATIICGLTLYLGPALMILAVGSITGKNPLDYKFRKTDRTTQVRQNVPRNPQQAAPDPLSRIQLTSLLGTNKFDLAQVQPQLMTWPVGKTIGRDVYTELKMSSIGKVYQVTKIRFASGGNLAGSRMTFRVYLPPDLDLNSRVPCILVPPAGSNLLTGREIDLTDLTPNPEHEPYLNAGFAVVTFSLDGALEQNNETTNQQLIIAHEAFRKSKAGLINCVHAFLETQAVIPGIDKNNVFIAGHSSAGTLSLLFAEHFPQIKGCLAYAPSVDLNTFLGEHLPEFKAVIPDIKDFLRLSSPQTHITDLKCPVFLFHSREDKVTSFKNSYQFAAQLTAQGTDVEFVASDGNDHYQTMIDEGLPKGIEWIKKQITKTNSSQPLPQMAAAPVNKNKAANQPVPQPVKSLIDVTKRKATFKVTGFDDIYQELLKRNPDFLKKVIISKMQSAMRDIVPGYVKGTEELDLAKMTFSFEYVGSLPADLPQIFADHFFAKAMKLSNTPPLVEIVNTDSNSRIMGSNFLTFRILSLNRLRFNNKAAPKIAEANLKLLDRYVPESLIINYDQRWAYIKLKGLGDKRTVEQSASVAFSAAGISVTAEKIDLSPADLAKKGTIAPITSNSSTTNPSQPGTTTPASTTKQKYIIRYGVYGGKTAKESAKRSLKGFVWVDQKSIQFNPDTKEISFINQSPVDQGALDRALTRNKFYQLSITQEPLPEAETETKKEEVKADTE